MSKKLRFMAIAFLSAVVILSCAMLIAINTKSATATDEPVPVFAMEGGVDIKLTAQGMRFTVKMDNKTYEDLTVNDTDDDKKLYFIIAPKVLMDAANDDYYNMSQKILIPVDESKGDYKTKDGLWRFYGCVTNMKEANRKLTYSATACIVDISGEKPVVEGYATKADTERNLYDTLNKALSVAPQHAETIRTRYDFLGKGEYPVIITIEDKTQYDKFIDYVNSTNAYNDVAEVIIDNEADFSIDDSDITNGSFDSDVINHVYDTTGNVDTFKDFDLSDDSAYTVNISSLDGYSSGFDVKSVKIGNNDIAEANVSYSGGVITITNSAISGVVAAGEQTMTVKTNNHNKFMVKVCAATRIIDSKADLYWFGSDMNYDRTTEDSYYILGADVSYDGDDWSPGLSGSIAIFRGTLDGRGYSITDLPTMRGLFKDIESTATVKNLRACIDLDGGFGGGALCMNNNGVVENCMVVVNVTAGDGTWIGGLAKNNSGEIKNCFVKFASYTGNQKGKHFNTIADGNTGTVSNCYAISSDEYSTYMYGGVKAGLYTTDEAFLEGVSGLSENNGWNNEYWSLVNGRFAFGDKDISVIKTSELLIDKSKDAFVLPSDVDATKVVSLKDGSTKLTISSFDAEDNSVTFNVSGLASGDKTLTFSTGAAGYVFTDAVLADMVITTDTELKVFGDVMVADEPVGKYYVLGADIDYATEDAQSFDGVASHTGWKAGWNNNPATKFRGTFDGRGHSITNYTVHRGLFGDTIEKGATVRNLYVSANVRGNADGAALCRENYGVIDNCMVILNVVKGETGSAFSGIVAKNNKGGEITNCLVKVASVVWGNGEYEKYFNALVDINEGNISDCYAISPFAESTYNATSNGLYDSDFAFAAADISLSETNGWNSSYWAIADGKIGFGDNISPVIVNSDIIVDKYRKEGDNCTVVLPSGIDATEIVSVRTGSTVAAIVSADAGANSITFDVSGLASGKKTVYLDTADYSYTFANGYIVDMAINNKTDLDAFGEAMKKDETTIDLYYILGADIDYGGANWSAGWYGSAAKFRGTFDGRGHAITNYVMHYGLFCDMVAGSEVKDLYVSAKLKGSAPGGALSRINNGHIENCMVILTVLSGETAVNFAGVAAGNNTSGEIRNCIVKVAAYAGEEKSFNAISNSNSGTISNCYGISTKSNYLYDSVPDGLYNTDKAFLEDVFSLSEFNGWNPKLWSLEAGKLIFSGKDLMALKTSQFVIDKSDAVNNNCTVVLPSDIDATKITTVSDVSTTIAITSANAGTNSVTFNVSGLASGEKTLTFSTGTASYIFTNAIVADMVINNKSDLDAFGDRLIAKTATGYYLLGNDIDYGGESWAAGNNSSAELGNNAIFNGNGHSITNFACDYGLFGGWTGAGSYVKNLYVSVKLSGTQQGGAICKNSYGVIKNCVIVVDITNGTGAWFGGVAFKQYQGQINNCFVKIASYTYEEGKKKNFNAIIDEGSTVSNCYAVSPYSGAMYGTYKIGLYTTDAAFIEDISRLPENEGWNQDFWALNSGKLTFGGKDIIIPETSEIIIDKSAALSTVVLPSDIDATKITTVSDGSVTVAITSANKGANSVTFNASGLASGEKTLTFSTGTASYIFTNVIVADMVISNKTELDAFGDLLKADNAKGYYILDADIDYTNAWWDPGYYNKSGELDGTLNGRGHKIYNIQYHWGFVRFVDSTGKIKNLYLDAKLRGNYNGGGISCSNFGVIENCLVSLTVTSGEAAKNFAGVTAINNASGKVNNCIVIVAGYTGEDKIFNAIVGTTNAGTVSNCYGISTKSNYLYGSVSDGLYSSDVEFLNNVDVLSAADNWSEYLNIRHGKFYFGDNLILGASAISDKWIVSGGASDYSILVPDGASDTIFTAADEFKYFFGIATGIEMTITTEYSGSGKYISFGDTSAAESVSVSESELGTQGFKIKTVGDNVIIKAAGDYGVLWGAYELLSEMFDYEYYAKDVYYIDTGITSLSLKDYDVVSVPDIEIRAVADSQGYDNTEVAHRFRQVRAYDEFWLTNAYHNSFQLVKDESGTVKDAYKAINTDPTKAGKQLCYTGHGDDDVVEEMLDNCVRNLAPIIEASDLSDVLFGIEDGGTGYWCQCDACKAIKDLYGTDSATMILFMNRLRDKLDDYLEDAGIDRQINIYFFAYTDIEEPPVHEEGGVYVANDASLVCKDGVGIMFAPIYNNFTQSIYSDVNATYYERLQKFKVITDRLLVWTYACNFTDYFAPYDSTTYMPELFEAIVDNNAMYIFNQGRQDQGNSSVFDALRQYLVSKLEWNVNADMADLTDEFFEVYFEDAQQPMRQIYDELMALVRYNYDVLGMDGGVFAEDSFKNYLSVQTLTHWLKLIEEAQELAGDDDALQARILRESIFIRYYLLKLYNIGGEGARRQMIYDALSVGIVKAAPKIAIKRVFG